MAFGKYLQDHPNQRQQPWKNFPSLFPPRFPQSSSYQSLAPANQLPAAEFLQRQFNLPKNAYDGNIKGGQSSVGQYWDGKNTLMKDGSSTPNGEIQKHKWPVQSTIKGVKNNLVDLNSNKKTNMEEKNILTDASNPNRDVKPLNKQLPETKVSEQMKQDLRQNNKETTLVENKENTTPKTGQNLNQVPDIANTEKSDIIQQPSSPSSGPIWGPPSTSNTVKMNGEEIPKIEMLKADKKAFDFEYDAQYAPRESISALVIGLTFVAIFIVMAFGLVAHTVYTKLNGNADCDAKKRYFGGRGGFIRSPNEEDRTPPELRSGCGQASFVQPELGNSMNGGYGGMRNGIPNGGNVDQNGTVSINCYR